MTDLAHIQKELGLAFKDPALLEMALTHSSFINESSDPNRASNERLEFLGDAVLGLVIAEGVYLSNPGMTEGEMTNQRSRLVRRETLARAAERINLGNYLELGKGEETNGGRRKPANLEAALEALIGAVFLDNSLTAAKLFVLRVLDTEIENLASGITGEDYKSALQELLQSRQQQPPRYRLTEVSGPDHDRTFTTEVTLEGTVLGTGRGSSKKAAETAAAREALIRISDRFTD